MSPIAEAIQTIKTDKREGFSTFPLDYTRRIVKRGCLYVGALPFGSSEQSIRKLFEPYGPVFSVAVNADWENPTFEPHAIVELQNYNQAITAMDGKKVGNSYLRVHEGGRHA